MNPKLNDSGASSGHGEEQTGHLFEFDFDFDFEWAKFSYDDDDNNKVLFRPVLLWQPLPVVVELN